MNSGDTTPEVSPIRSPGFISEPELEDGEISDNSENLSEISDDELETGGAWRSQDSDSPGYRQVFTANRTPSTGSRPVSPGYRPVSTDSRPVSTRSRSVSPDTATLSPGTGDRSSHSPEVNIIGRDSRISTPEVGYRDSPLSRAERSEGEIISSPISLDRYRVLEEIESPASLDELSGEGAESQESPASPADCDVVTGSPVKMIPVSTPDDPQPTSGSVSPVLSELNQNNFDLAQDDFTENDNTEVKSGPDDIEEGSEEDDNEEDIDEDILYLRLIALRSLADEANNKELSKNDKTKENHQMELEMEQLLQEAEKAAEEADEVVHEDQHESQKKASQKSLDIKLTTECEEVFVLGELNTKRGKTLDVIDLVSPVSSPTDKLPEQNASNTFSLTDIDENAPENIPLPSLPPLPDSQSDTEPPPQPPEEPPAEPPPEPPAGESHVGPAPPLPPASVPPVCAPPACPPPAPPPTATIISTRITGQFPFHSSSQAPAQTFSSNVVTTSAAHQFAGVGYPGSGSSVGQHFGYSVPYSTASYVYPQDQYQPGQQQQDRPEYSAVAQFLESSQTEFGYQFGWRNSQQENTSQQQLGGTENRAYAHQKSYDDYAPYMSFPKVDTSEAPKSPTKRNRKKRAGSKARKRRKTSGDVSITEEDEASLRAMLLSQVMNKKKEEKETSSKPEELKPVPSAQSSENKLVVTRKVISKSEGNEKKAKQTVIKLSNASKQPLKPVAKTSKKLSPLVLMKHFPNLSKKTIIPLNETDSDSEETEPAGPDHQKKNPAASAPTFQTNLDQFLKGMRQSKENKTPTLQLSSGSETRKKLSMKLRAKANMYIESDSKTKSDSNISRLPLNEQIEYMRLKQLIARKEAIKQRRDIEKERTTEVTAKKPKLTKEVPEKQEKKKAVQIQGAKVLKSVDANKQVSGQARKVDGKVSQVPHAEKEQRKRMKPRNASVERKSITGKDDKMQGAERKKEAAVKSANEDKDAARRKSGEKEEEEDEHMLRLLLLKDLQEKTKNTNILSLKKPMTINVEGDHRKVRVKKYNLTPHYKPVEKSVDKVSDKTGGDCKDETDSRKQRVAIKETNSSVAVASNKQTPAVSSSQIISKSSKEAKSSKSKSPVPSIRAPLASEANAKSSSPARKTNSPQPTEQSRPSTPSSPRSLPRLPSSSPRRNSNSKDAGSVATVPANLSITISNTSSSPAKKGTAEDTPRSSTTKPTLKSSEQNSKVLSSTSSISQDCKAVTKSKAPEKTLDPRVKIAKKPLINKQIDSKKSLNADASRKQQDGSGKKPITATATNKLKSKQVVPQSKNVNAKVSGASKQKPMQKKIEGAKAIPSKATDNKKDLKTNSAAQKNICKTEAGKNDASAEVPVPLETASKETIAELKKEEEEVIKKRGSLTTALFRISAQISQLEKWTLDLNNAVQLREKLSRELEQVDKLVKQREAGIDSTRIEIKTSHVKVTELREQMEVSEARCQTLGGEVYGAGVYKLSQKGSADYRRKLDQIKNSAFKFHTPGSKTGDQQSEGAGRPPPRAASGQGGQQPQVNASLAGQKPVATGQQHQQASGSKSFEASTVSGNKDSVSDSGKSAGRADTSTGGGVADSSAAGSQLCDYVSPLDHVRSSSSPGLVLDPDKMLCRFELGGRCMDAACPYQHCNK